MVTVAIICEYNPFHTGHEYQINKIREEFGEDTAIIAIMSGNFTQRGDVACADKFLRAECAVKCGANLVLELPFPFSCSSAEFFASAGVEIADAISCVDYLSFGSELGNAKKLTEIANNMLSPLFIEKTATSPSIKYRGLGYPVLVSQVYNELYSDSIDEAFFSPNNILAIEYIKALIRKKSRIRPHTFTRLGADYNEENLINCEHQSATAIRNSIANDKISALDYLPDSCKNTMIEHLNDFPCDIEKIASAIISFFRLNDLCDVEIQDANGGLYNRIRSASFNADSIKQLISLSDTKKYTTARIKRAIINSFFGVTSSKIRELPMYTQLLATDKIGQAILKRIKKSTRIPVLTKPSAIDLLNDGAKEQKSLCDRADSIFQLTKPTFVNGSASLTATPFIMK